MYGITGIASSIWLDMGTRRPPLVEQQHADVGRDREPDDERCSAEGPGIGVDDRPARGPQREEEEEEAVATLSAFSHCDDRL
jgi:hypothetical protein